MHQSLHHLVADAVESRGDAGAGLQSGTAGDAENGPMVAWISWDWWHDDAAGKGCRPVSQTVTDD